MKSLGSFAVTGGLLFAGFATVAAAQSTATVQADTTSANSRSAEGGLEELTVVAQRRSERAQDVPLSVASFKAETLKSLGIQDFSDLATVTPGLAFLPVGQSVTPYIRGVGTSVTGPGNEAAVATVIDDVYVPAQNGSVFLLNNVQSIEVDKGPQGTLFGRNATGGVVQVRTRDPQAEPSADIEAGYANYNTPSGTFYGTTGIAANLAADIALAAREQYTGWGTNLYTGKDDAFVSRDFNARSKWLWSPTDSTRVTMILSFNKDRSSDGAVLHMLPGDSWRAPNPDGTNPGPTVYTYPGFYNVDVKNLGFGNSRGGGGSLKVEQKFDPVDLVSISSYQYESSQLVLSADSTPADWVNLNFWSSERTFTQEFHLLSSEHSTAPLRWIVGTFLYYDKASADPYTISGNGLGPVSPVLISSTLYTHSYAAFGEMTYTIAQKTHVTAGLRYTEDYRAYDAVQTLGSPPFVTIPQLSGPDPTDPPGTFRKKYDKPTWTFAFNQDLTSNMNAYLRYARGFKSGTFNAGTVNNPPVNPEKIDSYEVGVKSYWLDRRLRADAAAFFSNYDNLQLQSYTNGVPELSNAAAARIKGLDFDTECALTNALSLQLSGEFLDAKYTSFPAGTAYEKIPITQVNPAGGMGGWYAIPGGENFAGNYMVNASRVTLDAGLNYDLPTGVGEFLFAGVAQFRSKYYLEAQNAIAQPGRTLINASIKWNVPNHTWYLQLWGNNLLNREIIGGATYQSGLPSIMVPLAPRTYGIKVGAHF